MVLIPWEIKGLYCMWFIADLTSPEELWVRVCCRGWYEGDIEDGVGGWCFTTFLTFSTFYNIWLLFYNVQCVGYAFKSNLVAFVSIFFFCFGFLNVFSRSLLERMNNHTCYISFPFLHCVFSNGSSEHFYKRMLSRTGCIYLCLLKCLFSCLLKLPASEYA